MHWKVHVSESSNSEEDSEYDDDEDDDDDCEFTNIQEPKDILKISTWMILEEPSTTSKGR